MIDSFQGENRWLSNFWPCQVTLDGETYNSTEAAYVAGKTTGLEARRAIRALETPGQVKRFGRSLKLRPDWGEAKVPLMLSLLRQKFSSGSALGDKLISTGSHQLIEGNTWGDTFWGVCNGRGKNTLGKLLMQVRAEIAEKFIEEVTK